MDDIIPEVIIASSSVCSIYDATNSNEITSYKDENTFLPKTLSMIGDDFLIGAYSNKPMLKVWTISKSKKQEAGSFVVPGIVSALAISNCSNYCVAGIRDQIFLWEVSSGELSIILNRHYQHVTCLKFTADDSCFLSGGKDGHVIVWVMSCVIDVTASHDTVKPHLVWNKHSAEVTDIYCGISVSRVASTSLDMTCNVYELDSGLLLSTICVDALLTSLVMDPLEYFIFLGDEGGYLYKINTYEKLSQEIHRADMNNKAILKLHDTKIISLSVTFDGTRLMTASEDSCKLWHMQSMACLLTIRPEGYFTNAFLAVKPPCLSNEAILPHLCVRTFQKDMSPTYAKKNIETNILCKELSIMYDGCPDKCINSSFLALGNKANVKTVSPADIEAVFEDAINGPSLTQVTALNQQLYSVSVNKALDAFVNPQSPS